MKVSVRLRRDIWYAFAVGMALRACHPNAAGNLCVASQSSALEGLGWACTSLPTTFRLCLHVDMTGTLELLGRCSQLRVLCLPAVHLDDALFGVLSQLPSLSELEVAGAAGVCFCGCCGGGWRAGRTVVCA